MEGHAIDYHVYKSTVHLLLMDIIVKSLATKSYYFIIDTTRATQPSPSATVQK